jgi:hypothetical protein
MLIAKGSYPAPSTTLPRLTTRFTGYYRLQLGFTNTPIDSILFKHLPISIEAQPTKLFLHLEHFILRANERLKVLAQAPYKIKPPIATLKAKGHLKPLWPSLYKLGCVLFVHGFLRLIGY